MHITDAQIIYGHIKFYAHVGWMHIMMNAAIIFSATLNHFLQHMVRGWRDLSK